MLDIKLIREEPDKIKANLSRRGIDPVRIDNLLELDTQRRRLMTVIDAQKAERNQISRKPGDKEIKRLQEIKSEIAAQEDRLVEIDGLFNDILLGLPNLIADDVPSGKDESENVVLRKVGKQPEFDFGPLTHDILGERLGIIDTKTAADVTGARFVYLKGKLVMLQMAVLNFAWSVLTDEKILKKIAADSKLRVSAKPFTPILPPVMIKEEVMARMARLEPKEERYQTTEDGLFLIGSAEHTMGPIHMDQILPEADLPLRYAGFSVSFRREAGSYGKDLKGIFRLHQFDKLEMETFCRPEDSDTEQNFIIAIQEYMMQQLAIPYQVVAICTGDMGSPDWRQIDIDSWLPGQGKYRETHTSDLMTDYQARRLNTRFARIDGGEKEFVHMNDATAFSMRPLIAIMENYQQKDGTINVPKILQKYTSFETIDQNLSNK